MRNSIAIFTLILISFCAFSQDAQVESTIRGLEQTEAKATLEKDTATLRKLWAEDFTVNAPVGRVVTGGKSTLDRPVITQNNYLSFSREVEHILLKGDFVFAMGNEVVVPKGSDSKAGNPVKRRYTNIWMKESGTWKLVARHANIICQ